MSTPISSCEQRGWFLTQPSDLHHLVPSLLLPAWAAVQTASSTLCKYLAKRVLRLFRGLLWGCSPLLHTASWNIIHGRILSLVALWSLLLLWTAGLVLAMRAQNLALGPKSPSTHTQRSCRPSLSRCEVPCLDLVDKAAHLNVHALIGLR